MPPSLYQLFVVSEYHIIVKNVLFVRIDMVTYIENTVDSTGPAFARMKIIA